MIRNVILHLHGEQPMKADIESLPSAEDAGLLCTNLRTLEGRKPLSTEYLDSVFLLPYNIIRFLEIPRAAIHEAGLDEDLPPSSGRASGRRQRRPGGHERHRHPGTRLRWWRAVGRGRCPGAPRSGRRAPAPHPRGLTGPGSAEWSRQA